MLVNGLRTTPFGEYFMLVIHHNLNFTQEILGCVKIPKRFPIQIYDYLKLLLHLTLVEGWLEFTRRWESDRTRKFKKSEATNELFSWLFPVEFLILRTVSCCIVRARYQVKAELRVIGFVRGRLEKNIIPLVEKATFPPTHCFTRFSRIKLYLLEYFCCLIYFTTVAVLRHGC